MVRVRIVIVRNMVIGYGSFGLQIAGWQKVVAPVPHALSSSCPLA